MERLSLVDSEIVALKGLLAEAKSQYRSVEDERFLNDAGVIAHEMPRRVRTLLNDFKQLEPPGGACMISSFPVDDRKIGRTPAHWRSRPYVSSTLEEEMLLVLFGSLLGDLIAWATQQNGYLLHDVLPIKDNEYLQISTGSQQRIWWHNEDAFHNYRSDYVGLMCLRNPGKVATTYSAMNMIHLDERQIKILFEPRFSILPDESQQEGQPRFCNSDPGTESDAMLKAASERIDQMHRNPHKVAVLFGSPKVPYLRLDPYFMDPLEDEEAQYALNALIKAIDEKICEVVLQPGDYLFIDNYRAVHGRNAFKAMYDGTDRWLKRANITRNLRKSRDARISCTSRIVY